MAAPALTYTLSNGTTADADQVMQNFNDLLNGITDGTKDLSIAALTAAGTVTLNGAVNLGNASGDDITVTGSLASSIPVKTTATYNVGSSSLGLLSVYFGNNSQTVRVMASGSASATWTLTLPTTAGAVGQVMQNSGSGTMVWAPGQTDIHSVSADYPVTDTDGYGVILVTTGSSADVTITLPTAADNTDRKLIIKKIDSGTKKVIVDGESTEAVEGGTVFHLVLQYDYVELVCNGTKWHVLNYRETSQWVSFTPTYSNITIGNATNVGYWRKVADAIQVRITFIAGTTTSFNGSSSVALPLPLSLTATGGSTTLLVGSAHAIDASVTDVFLGSIQMTASGTIQVIYHGTDDDPMDSDTPFTWTTSDIFRCEFTVPVTEWVSTVPV